MKAAATLSATLDGFGDGGDVTTRRPEWAGASRNCGTDNDLEDRVLLMELSSRDRTRTCDPAINSRVGHTLATPCAGDRHRHGLTPTAIERTPAATLSATPAETRQHWRKPHTARPLIVHRLAEGRTIRTHHGIRRRCRTLTFAGVVLRASVMYEAGRMAGDDKSSWPTMWSARDRASFNLGRAHAKAASASKAGVA